MNEIYLDNSATTRVYPEVQELMVQLMNEEYGNPSSMHKKGVEAAGRIREAKQRIAGTLHVQEKELIFTSCGTEGDNLAIIGGALANQRAGKHLITSRVEHPAVLESMKVLEELGFEVTYLPVDEHARIRTEDLKAALRPDTILVSLMYVNNEVGSVMPIAEAGAVIKAYDPKILFHVDGVQAYGKLPIRPKTEKIDLFTASGHKIHGPKGVGFLYVREGVKLKPLMPGGGQQKGMRSGTENVPGIAGLGLASYMTCQHMTQNGEAMYALKERFVKGLSGIEGAHVNGLTGKDSAPHVISVSFDGIDRSEVLLHALEGKGIYVSSGSACASNHPAISGTLSAMGVKKEHLNATLRFSMSVFTTEQEVDDTLAALSELLPVLRRFKRR
jgi:cysteine desulfurase